MKRVLIALLITLLNGCAVYDAFMLTGFDNNEYLLITQIRTDAAQYKTMCANPIAEANATQMVYKTNLFVNYSLEIPRNNNVIDSAKKLNEIAEGLVQQYEKEGKVSGLFCKLKYTNIENSAALIQHVVGRRPR
jgi:hypothetical protein